MTAAPGPQDSLRQAVAQFRQALSAHPQDRQLQMQAAAAFFQAGELADARQCLTAVLQAHPTQLPALLALGTVEAAAGNHGEAEDAFRRALTRDPHNAAALANLTALRLVQADPEGTVTWAEAMLARHPDHVPTLINLGKAANALGQLGKAAAALQRACRLQPQEAAAHAELAITLDLQGDWDAAYAQAQAATRLNPDLATGWRAMAYAAGHIGLVGAAEAAFDRLMAVAPDPLIPLQRLAIHPVIVDSADQHLAWRQRLLTGLPELEAAGIAIADPIKAGGPLPFYYAYDDHSLRDEATALAGFYRQACPALVFEAPHCKAPAAGGPPRVGFVSRFFGDHVIGQFFGLTVTAFAAEMADVTIIAIGDDTTDWSSLDGKGLNVVPVAGTVEEMQQAIADLALDALIFLDIGMEPRTYFLAHARLAPVQAMVGGHPVTTGIPTMDYYLSTTGFERPEAADFYTETLLYLDAIPAYCHRPPAPDAALCRADFGWSEDDRIFTCAQMIFKLHPDFDPVVAEILTLEPRGRFVLIEGTSQAWSAAWRRRFASHYPALADRIQVIPRQPYRRFLALLELVDAMIDPIHFGGGTTAWATIAMGVPMVTWPGRFLRGRATAGFYGRMGMTDLIAGTIADIAPIAVRLANDDTWKASLSQRILAASDRVYDQPGIVDELQAFVVAAVAAARRGERLSQWPVAQA
jgi:protein O-GlcNAc transferase